MVGRNVELLGVLPLEGIARVVSKARAFVAAGREDFGIAAVEAQACGTPVIAFRECGTTEVVQVQLEAHRTGVLFAE